LEAASNRAIHRKLANDNNNPASAGFPSVTRVFMPRYYYFLAYLLWLVMVLGTHDAQAARKDTIPNPFAFTGQTGIAPNTVVTSNTITVSGMTYLKDNRILPQGFDKATASPDIHVVGDALNDDNFIGGSDEIGYRIAGLNGTGYQVTTELIHQPLAYGFAQDLFIEPGAEIQDFRIMFQASNAKFTPITTHAFSVSR
jgi:hypothetical protein